LPEVSKRVIDLSFRATLQETSAMDPKGQEFGSTSSRKGSRKVKLFREEGLKSFSSDFGITRVVGEWGEWVTGTKVQLFIEIWIGYDWCGLRNWLLS